MNKKTVFIHIGLPKTGTTSIQSYLRRNSEVLASHGFCYPGIEFGDKANHVVLFNALAGTEATATELESQRKTVETQMDQFRNDASCHSLIFSHESLSVSVHRMDLKYLREQFRGFGITFVVYSRFSDEWLETLYQQYLWGRAHPQREHQFRRPLGRIEEIYTPNRTAKQSIRAISDHLGKIRHANIVVRSFDVSKKEGNLLPDFLGILGGDLQAAFPEAKNERPLNTSRVPAHSMLLYHLQRGGAVFPVVRDIALALNKRKNRKERAGVETRYFRFLPEAEILRAREQYALDVEQFPQLPAQPPLELRPAEYFLPREDAMELLNLLRGDIPDETYHAAAEAYAL